MADYPNNEKPDGLDVLTTIAQNDVHVIGDTSDSGKAKVITEADLETAIAQSTHFVDILVANDYFTTVLANSTNFITELTQNTTFQTNINNFVTGGSGGGGGTKIAIDSSQVITPNDTAENIIYTVNLPGGNLGTNDAVTLEVMLSDFALNNSVDETKTFRIKYGGVTIATLTPSIGSTPSSQSFDGAFIRAVIVASSSTSAQKAMAMFSAGQTTGDTSGQLNRICDDYGTATVDSTVDQDLVVTVQSNISSGVTAETIIVEKITSLQDGVTLNATAAQDLVAGNPVGVSDFVDNSIAIANVTSLTQAFPTGGSGEITIQIATDKIAVLYLNGTDLSIRVGTINRSTMAFTLGSAVTISTDTPTAYTIHKLDTDKFAVSYNTTTAQDVVSIVAATVSTNTITLGTPVTLFTAASDITISAYLKSVQNGTNAGLVLSVDVSGNQSLIAYTFSGTTATIGTPVTPDINGGGGVGIGTEIFIASIGTNKIAMNGWSKAQVATISGTTITLGTGISFRSGSSGGSNGNLLSISPATDVYICAVLDVSNEEYYCATVSGTTMSFGSALIMQAHQVYVKSSNELWLFESGITKVTITGNVLGNAGVIFNNYSPTGTIIDMKNGTFWGIDFDGTNIEYFISGMSQNYIGIVQNSPSIGTNAIVLITGTDNHQSGLIAGNKYSFSGTTLVQNNAGTIRAVSTTKIII